MGLVEPKLEAAVTGQNDPELLGPRAPLWGISRASVLGQKDRRFEAESYLSDGYGRRRAIEARGAGWSRLASFADVVQPPRLKGIVVGPKDGVPYLSPGQVFETRPLPHRWLSEKKTEGAEGCRVAPSTLLVTRSGNVGRVTVSHKPHADSIISDDLLRVYLRDSRLWGWLYALLKTDFYRSMLVGSHYGHVVKHIERSHFLSLPVIDQPEEELRRMNERVREIFSLRDTAADRINRAENAFAHAMHGHADGAEPPDLDCYVTRASNFYNGRRRLEAFHRNQRVRQILQWQAVNAQRVQPMSELCDAIWWPNRFSRVFGENGTPYYSAENLFNVNPPPEKRVYAGLVPNSEDYFLKENWLVMARSGQIYGTNGSVRLVGPRLTRFFISEDLIRIAPKQGVVRPGFLVCALSHPELGRPLVVSHAYGTSIPHLEPEDVKTIPVPRFDERTENTIADDIEEAATLRARADLLEDRVVETAEQVISTFLHDLQETSRGG